jgi:hypothetical protein
VWPGVSSTNLDTLGKTCKLNFYAVWGEFIYGDTFLLIFPKSGQGLLYKLEVRNLQIENWIEVTRSMYICTDSSEFSKY